MSLKKFFQPCLTISFSKERKGYNHALYFCHQSKTFQFCFVSFSNENSPLKTGASMFTASENLLHWNFFFLFLRELDPESHLCYQYLSGPVGLRGATIAVRAFNLELAKLVDFEATANAKLIRFEWWRYVCSFYTAMNTDYISPLFLQKLPKIDRDHRQEF